VEPAGRHAQFIEALTARQTLAGYEGWRSSVP
jgi:hypothetical protein